MGMAMTIQEYLDDEGVDYELLSHKRTGSSCETAGAAHIPTANMAKAVILRDDEGYLMAVIPASHHVDLGALHRKTNHMVGLATENDLADLFEDCAIGAIPPMGHVYGMRMMVDDRVDGMDDIYFEAGTHTDLVHVKGKEFMTLTMSAEHGHFSHPH